MWIDAHAHLDLYGADLDAALRQIAQHRIFTISNSLDLASYERNLAIAAVCVHALPIFGVHPWHASDSVDHLPGLRKAIEQSPMLGEIGLDYHFVQDAAEYPRQRRVFEYLLGAAREQDKIVQLHTKGAEADVLSLLEQYDIRRAVVHWYSGPLDILHKLVARGAYFTIGIEVRYSEDIQTIARAVPAERLLTETDNPGGVKSHIDGPGMPALLLAVVDGLAAARKTTPVAIEELVQANLLRLFSSDPWLTGPCAQLSKAASLAAGTTGRPPSACG
jgi:TatD DNase family protein